MESSDPPKHHLFLADSYLKYHLSKRDISSALSLCRIYRPLMPSFIKYSVYAFYRHTLNDVDRQSIRESLYHVCSSVDHADDDRLTVARSILCLNERFDLLPDIKNALVRYSPVEFSSLLFDARQLVEAVEVIDSFLHDATDLMKLRAARHNYDLPGSRPAVVQVQQFKKVVALVTAADEESDILWQEEP